MPNCLFCRIIEGETQSQQVFANDRLVAFKDINPQAPVHILIVPKKHVAALSLAEVEDRDILGEIQLTAKNIAASMKLEGFRLVLNNGRIAGQSVDHIHYHLLGGRRLTWPPG
ncbi:MAG: histidine triad nucleotide-binding protein [Elusimicrobia bacterium]|nr:histidine triad nucleotide-binding protein [Elusimicrobiota bacterium]